MRRPTLIVLWPYASGRELSTTDKLAILTATLVLAWLSKVLIEEPARGGSFLAAAPSRSFAFAGAGMTVVVGISLGIWIELDRRAARDETLAAKLALSKCYGPAALDPENGCMPPEGRSELFPAPEVVALQNTAPPFPECKADVRASSILSCKVGSSEDSRARVVALVGDSHAWHWVPAFDRLGKEKNWRVIVYTKSSCPFSSSVRVLATEQTDAGQRSCTARAQRA